MGHAHSHGHGGKKPAAHETARFTTEELDMLRLSFKDLAQRSPGKTIDKDTFLKFFPLPGLHGERLFHVFDNKHTGVIDYAEFVHGLAVCLRGTFDEKVALMFGIFDIDNNEHVSRAELNTMLLQVPRQALYVLSAKVQDQALRGKLLQESHCHGTQAAGGAVAIEVVRQLVDDAFLSFDLNHDDKLSPAQFELWVKSNPEVLHLLDSVFHLQGITQPRAHVRTRSDPDAAALPPRPRSALERAPSSNGALSPPMATSTPPPHATASMSGSSTHRGRRGFLFGRASHRGMSDSPHTAASAHSHAQLSDADTNGSDASSQPSQPQQQQQQNLYPPSPVHLADVGASLSSGSLALSPTSPTPPPLGDLPGDGRDSVTMRGTLYKAGKLTRSMRARFYVLEDSVLYYYHPGRFQRPGGVVLLQGCYVAPRKFGGIRGTRSSSGAAMGGTSNGTGSANSSGRGDQRPRRRGLRSSHSSHGGATSGDDTHGTSDCHSSHDMDADEAASTTTGGDDDDGADSGGECARALRSPYSEASIRAKRTRPADKHVADAPLSSHLCHMFPFEIITSQGGARDSRVLYAKTDAERTQWIAALQRASKVVPFAHKYRQLERLGHGKFAVVHKCELLSAVERNEALPVAQREYFAVKIIDKALLNEKESELLRTEIAVLKLVNHDNIISLEDVFESLNHIYIVQEFVQGGELFDRIVGRARLKEEEVFPLLRQLADAVNYLHVLGVAHRDIKPENILCTGSKDEPLASATLKICDFGLSKLVTPLGVMKLACGTLSYVAPEVLSSQGYGKAADIWSLGVIVYLVRRGRLPFDGDSKDEIIQRTMHAELDFAHDPVFARSSPDHVDLMRGLLCKDPAHRLTAGQVLAHPWMRRMQADHDAAEVAAAEAAAAAAAAAAAEAELTAAAAAAAAARTSDAAMPLEPLPPPSPPPPPSPAPGGDGGASDALLPAVAPGGLLEGTEVRSADAVSTP